MPHGSLHGQQQSHGSPRPLEPQDGMPVFGNQARTRSLLRIPSRGPSRRLRQLRPLSRRFDEVGVARRIKGAWQARTMLGIATFLLVAFPIPFYTDLVALRWSIVVVALGFAITVTVHAKPGPKAGLRVPRSSAAPGVVEDLATHALDRADRAMIGWLTVVGASHSGLFAVVVNAGKLSGFFQGSTRFSTSGVAFLFLGAICMAASHSIVATRQQAFRALNAATKLEGLGPYFRFVYEEPEGAWKMGLVATAIGSLGLAWMTLGTMLSLVGYLMEF